MALIESLNLAFPFGPPWQALSLHPCRVKIAPISAAKPNGRVRCEPDISILVLTDRPPNRAVRVEFPSAMAVTFPFGPAFATLGLERENALLVVRSRSTPSLR